MQNLIQFYFRLTLLKVKPQDCPASTPLLLFVAYFLVSFVNTLAVYGFSRSVVQSIVDLAVLWFFTKFLLSKHKERIPQTLNAFLGAGIIIGVIHTFFSYSMITDRELAEISQATKLIFFAIFIWVVTIYGHIIRHAIEVTLPTGISIALGYVMISIIVISSIANSLGF